MLEEMNYDRRRFLSAAAMSAASFDLRTFGSACVQFANSKAEPTTKARPGTNTSFDSLKQIDAGVLTVGCAEAGPPDGRAVILLHGWPYDIHSFVDVAPVLSAKGYRVIVPYLRGYGTTRFLSSATFRNGQPSAIALDIVALMRCA